MNHYDIANWRPISHIQLIEELTTIGNFLGESINTEAGPKIEYEWLDDGRLRTVILAEVKLPHDPSQSHTFPYLMMLQRPHNDGGKQDTKSYCFIRSDVEIADMM